MTNKFLVCVGILILLSACNLGSEYKRPTPPPPPAPSGHAVADGQREKDQTVVASADRIDQIVEQKGPEAKVEVKEQTDQIRAAVSKNPAEEVAKLATLVDEYSKKVDATFSSLRAENARLAKDLIEARDAVSKRVQFWFGLILRLAAAGLLFVAGFKIYAAVTSGLSSLSAVKGSLATMSLSAAAVALSWAVAQWWFYWACGLFAFALFALWATHAYIADRSRGAVTALASAIEQGKSDVTATVATVDLSKLKGEMKDGAKSLVKSVRKSLAKNKKIGGT